MWSPSLEYLTGQCRGIFTLRLNSLFLAYEWLIYLCQRRFNPYLISAVPGLGVFCGNVQTALSTIPNTNLNLPPGSLKEECRRVFTWKSVHALSALILFEQICRRSFTLFIDNILL